MATPPQRPDQTSDQPALPRVSVTARSFRTPEGQAHFEQAYQRVLAKWQVPYERFDVPTRFGTTHILAAGPQEAPPLVLLNAFGLGASSWYANVAAWSRTHRIYAVDVIGDTNHSVLTRPMKDRAQYAEWAGDVMDALGIASAPVVGHSYGGWVALNIALFAPERVDRLVLLAPAASFMPLNPQFGLRLMLMAMLRNRWSAMSFGRWTTKKGNEPPHELYDQFHQGIKHFRWGPILRPTVFTDAELSRIRTRTLLLIGDHEVILDWRAAIRRAQALLPDVQVEVIADAAHVLITEQPDRLNRQVLAFLKD